MERLIHTAVPSSLAHLIHDAHTFGSPLVLFGGEGGRDVVGAREHFGVAVFLDVASSRLRAAIQVRILHSDRA